MAAQILLVEDEPDLAKLVRDWLGRDNHRVDVIANGDEAMIQLKANKSKWELLILDLMLPGSNGIELCKAFRANLGTAPVLILTAKDSIDDKELGFKVGADDYMTKPFHFKELSARVSALLRRRILLSNNQLKVRDIEVDLIECKVTKGGEPVHLSPKEFRLLSFLMKHPNQVFSSEEILENIWEPATEAMNDTVRGHINRLRRKLDDADKPSIIHNVYGLGYKLEIPSD
ncbi:MAG TPA: response regulator transcription factor [Candidatus Obscuribacterales bacterium]